MISVEKVAEQAVSVDHQHLPCDRCCERCNPALVVNQGKCAICPAFGRQCNFGLPAEDTPERRQPEEKEKGNNPLPSQVPQPVNANLPQSLQGSQIVHTVFVPMIPIVHLLPFHAPRLSQVIVHRPVTAPIEPRMVESTIIRSNTVVQSNQQILQNPELSNMKKSKLGLSLVSTRRSSTESPVKRIIPDAQEDS